MDYQVQLKEQAASNEVALPNAFLAVCIVAFALSFAATIYFCRSMCCDMKMPGGWSMSMMWMRMPGQTWFASTFSFLLMWLSMMIAMMLPSALPMFIKTREKWDSLCYMASGYFVVWLVAGAVIYPFGVAFGILTMRSESLSRAIPMFFGASLVAAGTIQFTRWKMTHLLRCRSSPGCAGSCARQKKGFRLGCRQGAECCICCLSLIVIQLVLGIMDPLVMIAVATVVAAEKLLPRPVITSQLVGAAAILAGGIMLCSNNF